MPFPIHREGNKIIAKKKERKKEGRGFHGDSSREFLGQNLQF